MLSFPSKNADSKSNDIYFLHIHLIYSLSVSGLCCLLNLSPPSTDFVCVESWMETSYMWGMGLRSDGARHLAWASHLRRTCPLLSLAARLPGTGVSRLLPILLLVFWACRDLRSPVSAFRGQPPGALWPLWVCVSFSSSLPPGFGFRNAGPFQRGASGIFTHRTMQARLGLWVWSLGWEDALEEGMATHSSVLACRTPRAEEPGGLQPTASQRAGQDWSALAPTLPPACGDEEPRVPQGTPAYKRNWQFRGSWEPAGGEGMGDAF